MTTNALGFSNTFISKMHIMLYIITKKYNGCIVIEEFEPSLPRDVVWGGSLVSENKTLLLFAVISPLKEIVVFYLNKLHSFPFTQKCSELG